MDKGLAAIIKEWEFNRRISKTFINQLNDEALDLKLPRKGLDTFRKHFQEMIQVQRDYVSAIESGVMKFSGPADAEVDGLQSREELLLDMEKADADMLAALEGAGSDSGVMWFGEKHLMSNHLAALISHEAMHIGQIVAFCYALNIVIPKFVTDNLALSGDSI